MTATPRVYGDAAKTKAEEGGAVLASMDDAGTYGREFHRLGFGKAVGDHLLTDYKVLVLAIDEAIVDPRFQKSLADENSEIQIEDMAKIIGCWNGLSKRFVGDGSESEDRNPMKRAVAFARTIKDSKQIANSFQGVVSEYIKKNPDLKNVLSCELAHVDGSFNVLDRNAKLDWLKEDAAESTCRILTNARCLSEGVDVPALDAVLFLNPRDSMVDVVQSVGRIMRKSEGKKYGYVILPVGIPAGVPPEEALKDNKKYKVVWQVLQALRAHDDRFDAEVNKIELNKNRSNTIRVIGVGGGGDEEEGGEKKKSDGMTQLPLNLPEIEKWRDAIYAKIVLKCGTRPYWEDWAKDVAKIAAEHTKQIQALLKSNEPKAKKAFDKFLNGIRKNLNPSIGETDAIEMLSQQLITKPVFDALFEHYQFAENNSVSRSMDAVLKVFETKLPPSEVEALKKFYESVRMRVRGINNAEARQRVIKELYDRFFNVAFKKMSERLGIVYTPIEVVDFIIHSVEDVMQKEFGKSLSNQGIHILDPFTGTGTFIVRLLQSGIIKSEDLKRKFREEIHANELVLLAYYIASVNIEETYHEIMGGEYVPFVGGVLTDTFQLTEAPAQSDFEAALLEDHKRAEKQKKVRITVIISNPPYSAGQTDENDNNQNLSYPELDKKIQDSYAKQSSATLKSSLYDSYIRGIRWASDRIGDEGVVGFVTNGAFIDSNSADGLRKCVEKEFSKIYCFNLRGNQRTSGELSRQEGGKIFGSGSRTPVAVSIFVKSKRNTGASEIFYYDIGDYLSREEKLGIVSKFESIKNVPWKKIIPNQEGDWVNQRSNEFDVFIPLGDKKNNRDSIFATYSQGILTCRDYWIFNSSQAMVKKKLTETISFYNAQVEEISKKYGENKVNKNSELLNVDPRRISWSANLKGDAFKGARKKFTEKHITKFMYRPFFCQWGYFDRSLNERVYQMPKIFPQIDSQNLMICVIGSGENNRFSALITKRLTEYKTFYNGQCFPLYYYEKIDDEGQGGLNLKEKVAKDGHIRRNAITDFSLNKFKDSYKNEKITKEDIFYYVYGLLHSPIYRSRYQNDLKKMLPRIPLLKDFWGYSKTGRALAEVHLNYETFKPYALKEGIIPGAPKNDKDRYRVNEAGMRFPKEKKIQDKTQIIFNPHVRLTGIPLEAYNYVVNGKSAVEWVMERYAVTTDKDSGIQNDPNEWSEDPRYIVDLVKRVVAVSLETNKLVAQLPLFELLAP
ncbi:type ISP restriction/modification enzyme [Bdellovibrionota bacterium FG-1]